MYAEGDWRANSRLTINLGLRADINSVWSARNNLEQNFDFATQSFVSPNKPLYSGPTLDAAPRLGLNYDPFGHGKTVIRTGWGIFDGIGHMFFWERPQRSVELIQAHAACLPTQAP